MALQSDGLAASALAVAAFPDSAPEKVAAVMVPSVVRFVTNEPLLLLKSIVTLAAPRSAAVFCRLDAFKLPATSAVARSIALPSLVTLALKAPSATVLLEPMVSVSLISLSPHVKPRVPELANADLLTDAQVRSPFAAIVVAKVLAPQSAGLAAKAVAVVAFPLRAPLKIAAVTVPSTVRLVTKAPLVLLKSMLTLAAPRSVAAFCKLLAFRLPATSVVARSMAVVVLPDPTNKLAVRVSDTSASVIPAQVRLPLAAMALANWFALQSLGLAARAVAVVARSIVIELGMSPSVRAAQVKLPLAAMVVANWLAEQSVGLAAKALAVEALPVSAPLKLLAVIIPSMVTLVLKLPFVLPRLIVTSAAPRSAAALGKLLAAMAVQVRLPLAAIVVAN